MNIQEREGYNPGHMLLTGEPAATNSWRRWIPTLARFKPHLQNFPHRVKGTFIYGLCSLAITSSSGGCLVGMHGVCKQNTHHGVICSCLVKLSLCYSGHSVPSTFLHVIEPKASLDFSSFLVHGEYLLCSASSLLPGSLYVWQAASSEEHNECTMCTHMCHSLNRWKHQIEHRRASSAKLAQKKKWHLSTICLSVCLSACCSAKLWLNNNNRCSNL